MASKINAKTCCTRHVNVSISGSAVEANLAMAMWVSLFSNKGENSLFQCPVLIVGPGGCIDYQFKGVLFSGPVGRLNMKLIDCVHNTVVKEASITWPCVSFPNSCIDITMNFIASFAAYFQPLDKIIFDYERIPESCSVDPEKDPVEPDETITVNISGIKDSEGRTSADFQWILVDAKKGEIVNGDEWNGYKGFQVGGGAVNVKYKAPRGCKKDKETIVVYNSCWQKPEHPGLPENKIGDTTFTIEPKIIEAFIEFDHEVGFIKHAPDGVKIRVTESIKGMVPITIHLKDKPPSIKGKGTVASKDYGSRGGCTISGSNKVTVTITGVVKETKNKETQLLIKYGGEAPPHELRTVCGDKSFSVPNPNMAIGNDGEFIGDFKFLLEDGFRIHIPYGTGRGWNYILNVPCQRGSK